MVNHASIALKLFTENCIRPSDKLIDAPREGYNEHLLDTYIDSEEDKQQFLNNIERWNLRKDDCYDIIQYSINYCMIDCTTFHNLTKKFSIFLILPELTHNS